MNRPGVPADVGLQFEQALARAEQGEDLVAAGGDLEPATLLAAYRRGLFPMGLGEHGAPPFGWWSPDPRGVLPLRGLRVARSLRRAVPRFDLRVDTDFEAVLRGCADRRRDGRWITDDVARAYLRLHRAGHAHSIEAWCEGRLVGGLYGVGSGGLFAGESMFFRTRDASKVALVGLVALLCADGDDRRLVDVQWRTEHLSTLGVVELPRPQYLERLARALEAPEVGFEPGPLDPALVEAELAALRPA